MTNLELAICEAENNGEIDLDTRDTMLGILNEATRQAKESEKFDIRYIKPLYRKKHILENRERELEGKIYAMKKDKIYKIVDEDELDRLEKELQDVREKLKQCGEEIKKVEEKRDKIDKYGKHAFALSNGRREAKRRAGNSWAIALNKAIDKDRGIIRFSDSDSSFKDLGKSSADWTNRKTRAERYERPSNIYKTTNGLKESSSDEFDIYDESTVGSRKLKELKLKMDEADKKYDDFYAKGKNLREVYKNEGNDKMIEALDAKERKLSDDFWRAFKRYDDLRDALQDRGYTAPAEKTGKYLPGNIDDDTKARLNTLREKKRKKAMAELSELMDTMKLKYRDAVGLKKTISNTKLMLPSKRRELNARLDKIISKYDKAKAEYDRLASIKYESVLEEIYEAELCGEITSEERQTLIDYMDD